MGRSHKFSPNYHRIAILKEKTSKHHIITNLKCHWLDHSVLGLNFTIFKKTKTTKKKQPSFEEFQKPSCNCPSEVKYFSVNSLTIGWQASLLLWIKQNLFGGQLSRGKKKKKTEATTKPPPGNQSCVASLNSRAEAMGSKCLTQHEPHAEICQNSTVWVHCTPINTIMSFLR